jgi:hypothetical protein
VLVEKQALFQQLRRDSTQVLMTNLTELNQKEQTLVSDYYFFYCLTFIANTVYVEIFPRRNFSLISSPGEIFITLFFFVLCNDHAIA